MEQFTKEIIIILISISLINYFIIFLKFRKDDKLLNKERERLIEQKNKEYISKMYELLISNKPHIILVDGIQPDITCEIKRSLYLLDKEINMNEAIVENTNRILLMNVGNGPALKLLIKLRNKNLSMNDYDDNMKYDNTFFEVNIPKSKVIEIFVRVVYNPCKVKPNEILKANIEYYDILNNKQILPILYNIKENSFCSSNNTFYENDRLNAGNEFMIK